MSGVKIGKASPSLVKYRGDQANMNLLPAVSAEKLGGKGGILWEGETLFLTFPHTTATLGTSPVHQAVPRLSKEWIL